MIEKQQYLYKNTSECFILLLLDSFSHLVLVPVVKTCYFLLCLSKTWKTDCSLSFCSRSYFYVSHNCTPALSLRVHMLNKHSLCNPSLLVIFSGALAVPLLSCRFTLVDMHLATPALLNLQVTLCISQVRLLFAHTVMIKSFMSSSPVQIIYNMKRTAQPSCLSITSPKRVVLQNPKR